ncbi:MAG: metallophosphoesterase, partial [bacterium]|nr:metallophosphoesterase [bacterium]
ITGIEISDGDIRLVKWHESAGRPKRTELRSATLLDVLKEC